MKLQVGGATGAIGDPSGRSTERKALSSETLQDNTRHITSQIGEFLHHALTFALSRQRDVNTLGRLSVRNNLEWLGKLSLVEFLSSAGKQARVSSMLARDSCVSLSMLDERENNSGPDIECLASVKTRLNSPSGISFTEFTYNLLQAYDFHHLHAHNNVSVQLGGSDQYGNIMAGVEMCLRSGGSPLSDPEHTDTSKVYGLTMPLLTTASGHKFGKSAGNAIWLSDQLTSAFEVYQYFLRTADADVSTYLKTFTFLPLERIEDVLTEHRVCLSTSCLLIESAAQSRAARSRQASGAIDVGQRSL